MNMFLLHKTIEIISDCNRQTQCFDTIFYVESERNTGLNVYFRSELKALRQLLSNEPNFWMSGKIKVVPAGTKQFPAHDGRAYLYCGILPSVETCNEGCAFLSTDIEECPTNLLFNAIRRFYSQVLTLDDEILDTCQISSYGNIQDEIILPTDEEQDCVCIRLNENEKSISGFQDILSIAKTLPHPSHLTISRYPSKIILTDYDNLEISMPNQSMALYLLLLRHPKGILHKEMPDYKDEYKRIYQQIANRGDLDKLKQSVDLLFNLENDGNLRAVKCRCNQKIEQALPSRLRKPYLIQGKNREPRRILLDRKLLEMPM